MKKSNHVIRCQHNGPPPPGCTGVNGNIGLSRSYILAWAAVGHSPMCLSRVDSGVSRAWTYLQVQGWLDQPIANRDKGTCE